MLKHIEKRRKTGKGKKSNQQGLFIDKVLRKRRRRCLKEIKKREQNYISLQNKNPLSKKKGTKLYISPKQKSRQKKTPAVYILGKKKLFFLKERFKKKGDHFERKNETCLKNKVEIKVFIKEKKMPLFLSKKKKRKLFLYFPWKKNLLDITNKKIIKKRK